MPSQDNHTTGDQSHPRIGRRRQARRAAMQYLYQIDTQKGENIDQLEQFLAEFCDDLQARKLARQWIKGTWQRMEHIDKMIAGSCENWEISRISPVDLGNLRLAVFQLLDCPEIPPKVVINEAIELAKLFSSQQAPKFINGVLDSIQQKIMSTTESNDQ